MGRFQLTHELPWPGFGARYLRHGLTHRELTRLQLLYWHLNGRSACTPPQTARKEHELIACCAVSSGGSVRILPPGLILRVLLGLVVLI